MPLHVYYVFSRMYGDPARPGVVVAGATVRRINRILILLVLQWTCAGCIRICTHTHISPATGNNWSPRHQRSPPPPRNLFYSRFYQKFMRSTIKINIYFKIRVLIANDFWALFRLLFDRGLLIFKSQIYDRRVTGERATLFFILSFGVRLCRNDKGV